MLRESPQPLFIDAMKIWSASHVYSQASMQLVYAWGGGLLESKFVDAIGLKTVANMHKYTDPSQHYGPVAGARGCP